jgi:ferrous iron transport protein A
LSTAPPGERVRIAAVTAGRGLREHLVDMGLYEGAAIEVIRRGGPGPCLIRVNETRVAISRGIARKILVSWDGEKRGDT